MKTSYEGVKEWRRNTKIKLIAGFGGKCAVCGIIDDPCIYDIHHIDPSEKDFTISSKIRSWSSLVDEAKKCILLCAPCHRKHHVGLIELPSNPFLFNDELANLVDQKSNIPCPICASEKPLGQITCSRVCARKKRETTVWDTNDVVDLYNKHQRFSIVGSILGVSDVAVKKRLIKLGEIDPNTKYHRSSVLT